MASLAQALRRASASLFRVGGFEASSPACNRSSVVATASPRSGGSARADTESGDWQSLQPIDSDPSGQDPLWETVARELIALDAERRALEAQVLRLRSQVSLRAASRSSHADAFETDALYPFGICRRAVLRWILDHASRTQPPHLPLQMELQHSVTHHPR